MRTLRAELVHRINRRGVRRASSVVVMTNRIQNELIRLYPANARVIRPGISANGFGQKSVNSASDGRVRVLSVGRLESSKRIDWILQALAALDNSFIEKPDWLLEIVGDGPAAEPLKQLAQLLGLDGRTVFLGHVSEAELAKAYARASLFVMPAVQGYGLPALEALSRGLPTIVHKDSGVSEILEGSPWVELVDGDKASLAEAIRIMMGRLQRKDLMNCGRPALPTSSEWAKAVCDMCGWI
jgi:glycosyltransferase involved in cell wall biosynthesis